MSLISTRNLVAPLTNKLHMITIVLLTTAFVVLRLSGGAVRVENKPGVRSSKSPSAAARGELPSPAAMPKEETSGPGAAAAAQDEARGAPRSLKHFQEIIDEAGQPPWEEKKAVKSRPAADPSSKKKGGLEDLEKALGIK
jgi:hypothetical protein